VIRDTIKLGKPRKTAEGFLVASGIAARVGVLDYPEYGFTAYVPADTLKRSAEGLEGLPLTLHHPEEGTVTPKNAEKHAVGSVKRAWFDEADASLCVEVVIWRADAIEAVEKEGVVELSPGYKVVWEEYQDPEGKATRLQAERSYNHLSLVDEGRGGPTVRLNLDSKGAKIMTIEELAEMLKASAADMNMKIDALVTRMDAYEKPEDEEPDEDEDKPEDEEPAEAADSLARLFRAHKCGALLGLKLDPTKDTNLEAVERKVVARIVGDAKAKTANGAARSLLIEAEIARRGSANAPKPADLNGGSAPDTAFDAGKLDMSRPASRAYLDNFGQRKNARKQ
jgi:hypothetical protein